MTGQGRSNGVALVAVDGSPPARAAASVAIRVARGERASVSTLYVVDAGLVKDPYASLHVELGAGQSPTSATDIMERFRRHGEKTLALLEDECRTEQVPVHSELIFGRVVDAVLERASTASFLALGRRGHRRATEVTHLGAHFRTIAYRAPCPLIAGGSPVARLQHVLLAYNGSQRARRALAWVERLRRCLAVRVTVVSARERGGESPERLQDEARQRLPESARSQYVFVSRDAAPLDAIIGVARECHVDAVVLGGYRHSAAIEWLVGSTLEGVATHVDLPLFIA